jgi:Flp pilus assembly pilin Flp
MQRFKLMKKQLGQGMTEYIIIVALIAIGAVGVYTAFGDVVRGQTSVAAATLSGNDGATGRELSESGYSEGETRTKSKGLVDFESDSRGEGGGGE